MKLHPIAELFPEMSNEEYQSLVKDIEQHGVLQPILIHNDQIVDGRHRFQACQDLGIPCPTMEWNEQGSLLTKAVSLNLKRRHLSASQIAVVSLGALPLFEAEAKERQRLSRSFRKDFRNEGEAREQVARLFGTNPHYVSDAKKIQEISPERFEKIRSGSLTIPRAKKEIRLEQGFLRRSARAEQENNLDEQKAELWLGDFQKLLWDVESDSVDLLLTDPPYAQEYRQLWAHLAQHASRILRPGGFLIAYSGQNGLPEILNALGEHLDYYWLAFLRHTLNAQRFEVQTMNAGKPILIYNKPPRAKRAEWFCDLVNGSGKEKGFHKWQQDLQSAETILQAFSQPGQVVVDPCMGSGTIGLACKYLKRKFIGVEIDEQAFFIAQERLNGKH